MDRSENAKNTMFSICSSTLMLFPFTAVDYKREGTFDFNFFLLFREEMIMVKYLNFSDREPKIRDLPKAKTRL